MIVIGADGGGTKTVLAAFENGARIAEAHAGPLNYRVLSPEEAARNLTDGILSLGLTEEQMKDAAALGIADPSLDDAANEEDEAAGTFYGILRSALPFPVFGRSDAYITLCGLAGVGPGTLVISGTGAMGIARNHIGEIRLAGGWGRLTGDEGSGYYIAAEGIRSALRAFDGVAPETRLTAAAAEFFGVSPERPRDLIPVFYAEPAPDIAAFSAEVARIAEAGDAEALRILDDAAHWLALYAAGLVRWSGSPLVGIYGSVLTKNGRVRAKFGEELKAAVGEVEIEIPARSAEEAAALYAETELNKLSRK
ncbi:MAG: hypothetical protein II953_07090 [Clostridia bacterium]|nr:hypothetical protein [Clostridia bacterium]